MAGFGVGGVKTGMISGRIWLDSNEDGIMGEQRARPEGLRRSRLQAPITGRITYLPQMIPADMKSQPGSIHICTP